jgi:hypothetical protein
VSFPMEGRYYADYDAELCDDDDENFSEEDVRVDLLRSTRGGGGGRGVSDAAGAGPLCCKNCFLAGVVLSTLLVILYLPHLHLRSVKRKQIEISHFVQYVV